MIQIIRHRNFRTLISHEDIINLLKNELVSLLQDQFDVYDVSQKRFGPVE